MLGDKTDGCGYGLGGFETMDSGERRAFATGSQRDAATGKGRYDLVSPLALERLAQLYERGAVKYDARNWEKGQPLSVYLDCAMRHLQKHLAGCRDEDHMAAAAWNCFSFMHTDMMIERGMLPAELSDLPDYQMPWQPESAPVAWPEGFVVEVQLPCGPNGIVWSCVGVRASVHQALAVVQALRNAQYAGRVMRVTENGETVCMVWPGDAPVADFAVDSRP